MARIINSSKAGTVNPLKSSQPLGAALAYLGLADCMPLMHGAQGCTSFGLVLLVRHFREAIPLQTTAMSEVATVLGGMENLEEAILNIHGRAKPRIIGICTTGVTETKGDDIDGFIRTFRDRHPELKDLALVATSTPDYQGSLQEGWARAVTRIVGLAEPERERVPGRVNVLPGSHLTAADLEEIREILEAFDFSPVFVPDLSSSLDGRIPDQFTPTTLGGTTLEQLRDLGAAELTIAIGEHMRPAADALGRRTQVPYVLFEKLTGLEASDELIGFLANRSGKAVPAKYRRQRAQLIDAMLDGHFFFGGQKIAIAGEPDVLWSLGGLFAEMGSELTAVVSTISAPILQSLPKAEEVLVGDLEDLERLAKERQCSLLVTHSHGRQAAERLHLPLFRAGLPIFDRLGSAHRLSVGYRGTRDLIFEIGNLFLANGHEVNPDTWREDAEHAGHSPVTTR